ncbi:MAG TPA: Clp protease N-terminal domain-containing protein [Rubrobacteraceae bacterium]|nr:Clp protease N-terminal domain-containing protein [Rubrobacteraceae bacterium]
MFDRFTKQARKAMVLAKVETHHFNHDYIGTEHLLLGLLRENEDVAARALGSMNITLNEVREQVEDIVRYEERETDASVGQGPFSPRSKRALESSLRESLRLGHRHIGTEHILLGIADESDSVAVRILSNPGISTEKVRSKTTR